MPTSQDIHYLFDMRGTPISSQAPFDVSVPKLQPPGLFDSVANNGFVLNIPNGLNFSPTQTAGGLGSQSWDDIVTEKHAAILAQNPGFSFVVFDDMADANGWDMSLSTGVVAGSRGSFILGERGTSAQATTNAVSLVDTPAAAILWFETFVYMPDVGHTLTFPSAYSNPKDGRFRRVYRPLPNNTLYFSFDVSFNGGSTYMIGVGPQQLLDIDPADQGSSFRLRVKRKSSGPFGRVGIGGWALVY